MRILTLFILLLSSPGQASEVFAMGSLLPPLHIEEWIGGPALISPHSNQITIIHFFSTWCLPCLQTLPYFNSLKQRYGDQIELIAVAANEGPGEESLAQLREFLGSDRINHAVGVDQSGITAKEWTGEGIPMVYVIDQQGALAFKGPPGLLEDPEFENPLAQIVAQSWSQSSGQKAFLAYQQNDQQLLDTVRSLSEQISKASKDGDWKQVLNLYHQGAQLRKPYDWTHRLGMAKILIENLGREAEGLHLLKELSQSGWDRVQGMGVVLKLMAHPNVPESLRDLDEADRIAARLIEYIQHHPDPSERVRNRNYQWLLLPAVAQYYALTKRFDLAWRYQGEALGSLPDQTDLNQTAETLTSQLEEYEQAQKACSDPFSGSSLDSSG